MFNRIVVRIRKGMKYFTDIQQSWDVGSVCWLCCGERHNLGFRVVWWGRETRSYWTFPCQLGALAWVRNPSFFLDFSQR
jgi:hypothetical protein